MSIKSIYQSGFTYSPTDDENTIVPAIVDVVQGESQMANPDTDVVWDSELGAARFFMDFEEPTETGSTISGRTEHTSRYPHLMQAEEMWFSASYYFPVGEAVDPEDEILYQWHVGAITGSPSVSIRRKNGRFVVYLWIASGFEDQMAFDIGPATNGIRHDFVVYLFMHPTDGHLTVWKDGMLARCHNPLTGAPWSVPTSPPGGGITNDYTAYPELGAIQQEDAGVSLLVWNGKTARGTYPNPTKYPKWGMYKPAWGTRYNPDKSIKPESYDPLSPLYVAPEFREKTIYISNIKFETRVTEFSHTEIFKSLDIGGSDPLELPNWWVEDIVPVEILSPEDDSVFSILDTIEVETNAGSGTVELKANGNVIGAKTEEPYIFTLPVIPKNGSVVDLPFDGNLHDWGLGLHDFVAVNTDDVQYVEGVRGQAISLGNNELHAQKSYLDLSNTGLLSEIDNQFTIAFWLKSQTGSGLNPYVLSSYSTGGSGIGLRTVTSGGIDGSLYNASGVATTLRTGSGHNVSSSEFNHFSLTYDGDWLRWYYNFELSSELQVGDIDISATGNWYINAAPNQAGRQNIQLDDFRIYNYAVSEEDISSTSEDNFLGQIELVAISDGLESIPVIVNIVDATATVNVSVDGNGTVTGAGTYEVGEEVTLVAIPDAGYRFVRWSNDVTDNPYSFEVTGDVTLQAIFAQEEPTPGVIVVKGKFRIV